MPNILIACFGNVLRADDGFGFVVARCLLQDPLPDGVRVMEVGIGGIHLVQELLDPVDALIVVDAVDIGRRPGTVVVIDPEIRDLSHLSVSQRRDELADMHLANPDRVFLISHGLGILPQKTYLVGCQIADDQTLRQGLSKSLQAAVETAVATVHQLVADLGVPWPDSSLDQP